MKLSLLPAVLCALAAVPCLPALEDGAPAPVPPFRFRGGERVKLVVAKEVGESIEQLVTDDGFVALPTGGAPVNIRGKTVTEAHALINAMLEKQSGAKRVAAALAVLDIPPRKVYVGGEVKLAQALVLPPGVSLTLGAALASAGGATPDGDISRITVVQTGPGGKTEVITYDASRLDTKNLGPNLEPGAVITVPRGDVFILAGEVTKSAALNRKDLSLGPGEPAWLTRVLFAGGGLKPTASRKDIRLIRTAKDGTREVIPVNLDAAIRAAEKGPVELDVSGAKERAEADPLLQNGDIILAGSAGGVTILGKVKQPGVYPLAGDTLKLSRLLALAGGFAEFAKTSSVTVIRASAPKKPIRVDTSVITRDGDLEKDLDLEDGDLVFVSERLL